MTADRFTIHQGDALAVLRTLPSASVDALITDPPYSSGGMFRGDRQQDVHAKYVSSDSGSGQAMEGFTGDSRDQRSYGYWVALWLGECMRIALPGFYQASPPREREHITQKPVEIMRSLMRIVPPGGMVLDPFCGSGTTGVAALLEGRRFIGSEQSAHFVEVARKRCGIAAQQGTEQSIFDLDANAPPPSTCVAGDGEAGK